MERTIHNLLDALSVVPQRYRSLCFLSYSQTLLLVSHSHSPSLWLCWYDFFSRCISIYICLPLSPLLHLQKNSMAPFLQPPRNLLGHLMVV